MDPKTLTPVEMHDAVKIVFLDHGGDLPTVITSIYLTLAERCATLEQRLAEMEAKQR